MKLYIVVFALVLLQAMAMPEDAEIEEATKLREVVAQATAAKHALLQLKEALIDYEAAEAAVEAAPSAKHLRKQLNKKMGFKLGFDF